MREPPDLNELVGDELSPDELGQLRKGGRAASPRARAAHDVPASLTAAVAEVPLAARRERRGRRVALALAFAAVLAAASFGIGHWAGQLRRRLHRRHGPHGGAPGAAAVVQVGERDEGSGNVELLVVSSRLLTRPRDYYALWLEQDGEWTATCGYFAVGEGETSVGMTVSYDFRDFDAWIISAADRDDAQPLLTAEIPDAWRLQGRAAGVDEGLVRDRHLLGEEALARLRVAADLPLAVAAARRDEVHQRARVHRPVELGVGADRHRGAPARRPLFHQPLVGCVGRLVDGPQLITGGLGELGSTGSNEYDPGLPTCVRTSSASGT